MRPFLKLSLFLALIAAAFGKPWTVGVSQCNLGEPWRVQMNAELKKAAEAHPELTVIFKDAQNDTLKQRAQIEEFASAGVDLLIVSPKEAAPLTAPVAEVFQRGIPVIVLDRRVLGDKFTQFIGADNRLIGQNAGVWVARQIAQLPRVKQGGKARIVELKGLMTSTPAQDRHAGFRAGVKAAPVEFIFEADMKWLEADARREMESALAVHDSIDVVFAHNDPGAHGAYLAAKAAGREKEMIFVGIDALPQEGRAYVQQGIMQASFEYPTGGMQAIESALKILRGEKLPKEVILDSATFSRERSAK